MAATVEARRLTEAHRLGQARLGAALVRQLLVLWPLLDVEDLDGTAPRWLRVAMPLVQAGHRRSAGLAVGYLTAHRTLELGVGELVSPVLDTVASAEALATSLVVTGPVQLRAALARGVPMVRALEVAQSTSARSGMRHALSGGRNTVIRSVAADRRALGWSRVTSGKPCAFCAMLASRGPVYKTQSRAQFQAHDACACSAEPVYRRDSDWPPGARGYQQLWKESTQATSGRDAINAFRRAFEAA